MPAFVNPNPDFTPGRTPRWRAIATDAQGTRHELTAGRDSLYSSGLLPGRYRVRFQVGSWRLPGELAVDCVAGELRRFDVPDPQWMEVSGRIHDWPVLPWPKPHSVVIAGRRYRVRSDGSFRIVVPGLSPELRDPREVTLRYGRPALERSARCRVVTSARGTSEWVVLAPRVEKLEIRVLHELSLSKLRLFRLPGSSKGRLLFSWELSQTSHAAVPVAGESAFRLLLGEAKALDFAAWGELEDGVPFVSWASRGVPPLHCELPIGLKRLQVEVAPGARRYSVFVRTPEERFLHLADVAPGTCELAVPVGVDELWAAPSSTLLGVRQLRRREVSDGRVRIR